MGSSGPDGPGRPPVRTVLVAIATYRRPGELARLLTSLKGTGELDALVHVLVVDNDAAGSARSVVVQSPTTATYVVEPQPGIAAARNRALDEAEGYDAIIFVDDDEWVDESWLAELLAYADRR